MSKGVCDPLAEGTVPFRGPRPGRGEIDQLLWDELLHSCDTGYWPLLLGPPVPRQVITDGPVAERRFVATSGRRCRITVTVIFNWGRWLKRHSLATSCKPHRM